MFSDKYDKESFHKISMFATGFLISSIILFVFWLAIGLAGSVVGSIVATLLYAWTVVVWEDKSLQIKIEAIMLFYMWVGLAPIYILLLSLI